MQNPSLLRLVVGCAFALLTVWPQLARAEAKRVLMGHVIGVSGDAILEGADGERRPMMCGTALYENDRVITQAGGRASILAGDVYAQIAAESELRLSRTPAGAPDIAVLQGRVRLIDTEMPGGSDAPHRISTPDAEIIADGSDTEALVTRGPDRVHSMLCEWGTAVGVRALGDGSEAIARPGECATARPHLSIFRAAGDASKLAVAEDASCDLASVTGNASDLLSPFDVAAGGRPGRMVGSPGRPSGLGAPSCSVPGSCGGGGGGSPPSSPPHVATPVFEPPAVIGLPPGAPRLPGRGD